MCGIAGIYSFKGKTEQYKNYLDKCTLSMKHRGPDDKGFWTNEKNYSAVFVRLSIRDLSINGHQPMLSSCGNFALSFNGEIYNSDNYISQLEEIGVVFKSHSDTEVLLYALIHLGLEKVLAEFDGMFAFAFYDNAKDELIIARDRVGIKPLYVGYSSDHLIYSSQYDHIINVDFVKNNSLNYSSISNYLAYGYMIGGDGVVQNTIVLPQGHYLVANNSGYKICKFYDFSINNNVIVKDAEELFRNAIKEQMVSDVPVGTFLSGGVDSPLINFWASELQRVKAFTIGNDNKLFDEGYYAKEYANKIGVEHHYKIITEKDFLELVDDTFKAFTEPFADFSSIPTMLVSKLAKEHVTVILSGDGPDELFWGYDRNLQFPKKAEMFQLGKLKLALKKMIGHKNISKRFFTAPNLSSFYLKSLQTYGAEYWLPKVFKHKSSYNEMFNEIPDKYKNPTNIEDCMQMIRWLEMNIHLQRILLKVDRSTMYYSIEARVPYLSNKVLDYASSLNYKSCISNQQGKSNVKEILAKKIPAEWVYKKKQGFGVPMKDWIGQGIKSEVYNTIMNMPDELAILFNRNQLEAMLQNEYISTKEQSSNGFIWSIYALVKWHQLHRRSSVLQ